MFRYQKKIHFQDLETELSAILDKVANLKLPQGFTNFLFYVIGEIFDNIKLHSQAKKITVNIEIKAQKSKIKIADDGIGFRNSYLKKGIYAKDDATAIEFALSGLSTKNFSERGFGLYSIRNLVSLLKGKLLIESGFAKAVMEDRKLSFRKIKFRRGVWITIETPVRKLNIYKILR